MTFCNASAPGSAAALFTRGQVGAVGASSDFSDTTTSNPCEDLFRSRPSDFFAKISRDIANTRRIKLRPEQQTFLSAIYSAINAGYRRLVGQAPTGYGKTITAAAIILDVLAKGKRPTFIVDSITLIDQTVERLTENGIPRDLIGVIQADHPMTDPDCPVQVCSVQTLQRRNSHQTDVVIIDEVHCWHRFYDTLMKLPEHANTVFIGLSATPWRKGLGRRFQKLIIAATTRELIDLKRLSDFRVFAPSSPDLKGIKVIAGDYHEGQLSKAMSKPTLVADVVTTWLEPAEGRATICFAVDRAHAKHLQEKFQEAGVVAGYIDSFTDRLERARIRKPFHDGVRSYSATG
jgi:DNA repair protein RadD